MLTDATRPTGNSGQEVTAGGSYNNPTINETAVTIAADIAGVFRLMVEHWIQGALDGTEPLPANTLEYRAWVAYRAAVAGYDKGYSDCLSVFEDK